MVGLQCAAGCGDAICREGSRGNSTGGTTFLYISLVGAFITANGWSAAFPDALNIGHPRQKHGAHIHRRISSIFLICLGLQVLHEVFFLLLSLPLFSCLSFSPSPVLCAASSFTATKRWVFPAEHSWGASRTWSTAEFLFLPFIHMQDCSERWKFQWNGMLAKSMH